MKLASVCLELGTFCSRWELVLISHRSPITCEGLVKNNTNDDDDNNK